MGNQTKKAQLAFDSALPFDTSSKPVVFLSCDVSSAKQTVTSDGIRGTFSRYDNQDDDGIIGNRGTVVFEPPPDLLDWFLPFILGGTESTNNFPVDDEPLDELWMMYDRVAKVHTYTAGKIAKAVLSGGTNRKWQLALDLIFKTESEGNAGTFPTGMTYSTQRPYMFHQAALVIGGTTYDFGSFELTIDRASNASHNQSQTAQDIDETDRVVMLTVETPYTADEIGLHSTSRAAATLTFTNGGLSTAVNLASLLFQSEQKRPALSGSGEIRNTWNFLCRRTAATAEISIDNDPVA